MINVNFMPKLLMIIAQEGFRDEECFETKNSLAANNIEVLIAAPKKDIAKGSQGKEIMPDLGFDEIKADDFQGICLVGGQGSKQLVDNEKIMQLIKEFDQQEKLISAICYAPVILAKAKVLDNKKATCHLSAKQILQQVPNLEFINENVVVDNRVITADGPEAAFEFGEAIAKYLNQ